jgi:hypothetical protein
VENDRFKKMIHQKVLIFHPVIFLWNYESDPLSPPEGEAAQGEDPLTPPFHSIFAITRRQIISKLRIC